MTRKELCKIAADLSDTSENREIQREYWNAVRANDDDRLSWFASFGKDARHRIMNLHQYRRGLLFGFTEISLDEYGWLERSEWPVIETIEFKTNSKQDKNFTGNYITLAAGPNMRWTYSVHYQHGGGSGGGYACHVHWHDPYKSRQAALLAALDEIKDSMESGIKHYEKWKDQSNYDPAYMRKVLDLIKKTYPKKEKQLSLAL